MDDPQRDTVAGHEARLAGLDPLLPASHPLPEPGDGDVALAVPGAVALARRETPDPESLLATWGAAVRHRLLARVAGPAPAAAMAALLDRWHDTVAAQAAPGDHETEAGLTWPSRDVAMTRVFLDRGLVPSVVIAARPAGRATPPGSGDATVRALRPADIDAATQLWVRLVQWDAQFGSITERPTTGRVLRQELVAEAGHDPCWAWVAESGGALAGLLIVSPPERAEWVAPLTAGTPAAYLGCMVVDEAHRGGGTGAALVRQAHAALDAAGVGVTLLHYSALNPLSPPFWHRCGYRPLWTSWHAHPASALRLP